MRKLLLSIPIILLLLAANPTQAQRIIFSEDFNAGVLPPNWTDSINSGSFGWSFGIDGAADHSGNQNLDGTNFAYFDDDGLGQNANNNTATLYGPVIDISNDSIVHLLFDYNSRFFNGIADSFKVDVFDGTQWVNVFYRTTDDCGNYLISVIFPQFSPCLQGFPHASINVTPFKNPNFQFRFKYHDGNGWGWYVGIDNVELHSTSNKDLSVVDFPSNFRNCGLSSAEPIQGVFRNVGYGTIDTFQLAYQIDTLPLVWETVIQNLLPGDSILYTFNQTADLSRFKTYEIKLVANLNQDTTKHNDTLVDSWYHKVTYPISVFDDFEDTNVVWVKEGTSNNSWERGFPSTTQLNATYHGNYAMVTNDSGNYNNDENSFLVSPCYLKKPSDTAIVGLHINHKISFPDQFSLQTSTDEGKTWSTVSRGTKIYNWGTNGANSNVFQGRSQNDDWVYAINSLGSLTSDSVFQIRLRFGSNFAGTNEGVAIDDLYLSTTNDPEISVESISSIDIDCRLEDTTALAISMFNYGFDTLFSYNISYRIDSGAVVTETANDTVLPFSDFSYQFNQKANFSAIKSYSIDVWVDHPDDVYPLNDSLLNQVYQQKPIAIQKVSTPYFENFDHLQIPNLPEGWRNTKLDRWRTNSFNTPSFNTGPDQDNTTGNGNYLYVESSGSGHFATPKILNSPCISLEGLNNPVFTYWLHMHGQSLTGYYVDIYNGSRWIEGIESFTSELQTIQNQPFEKRFIDLSPFKDQKIQLRFRSFSTSFTADASIDDLSILDASLLKGAKFDNSCNASQKIAIVALLENLFPDSIQSNTIELSYQLNKQALFIDTLQSTLMWTDTLNHVFSDSLDLSQYTGDIKLLVKARNLGGPFIIQDSIELVIPNPNQGSYLSENFESFELSQPLKIPNWEAIETWKLIDDRQIDPTQIPSTNATSGGSKYINNSINFRTGITTNRNAELELPCLAISPNDSLSFRFKYNLIGDSSTTLYIRLENTAGIQFIDTINGALNQDSWQHRNLDLFAYAGQTVNLSFYFVHNNPSISNGVSLDDIQIVNLQQRIDASLNQLTLRQNDCFAPSAGLNIQIENKGGTLIPANSITANYQIQGQAVISQLVNLPVNQGELMTYPLNPDPAFGIPNQTYQINSWISLFQDAKQDNDSISAAVIVTNNSKDSLNEDFNALTDLYCSRSFKTTFENGWSADSGLWSVQNGLSCNGTPNPLSGPLADHGSGTGNFMYINSVTGSNQTASLTSPCLDMSRLVNPTLTYWYHMYGSDINSLRIESNASGPWQVIDSIVGQQQTSSISPWRKDSIALSPQQISQNFQIRFTSLVNGARSQIAIDDIKISGDSIVTGNHEFTNARNLNSISVYPNPNNGQFFIQGSKAIIGKEYQIINLQGQLVEQGRINKAKTELRISNESKGIYLLIIPELRKQRKVVVY